MLFKIAGAVLVIAASSGLGCSLSNRLKARLNMLEQLKRMIFLLKGEILYANAPLEEAFERVGEKSGGILGDMFAAVAGRIAEQRGEPFFTMWKEEIQNMGRDAFLSDKDRQDLTAFGEHLGYLDSQMQERTILLYLEQLELTISYLRDNQKEKSRLYTSLGVMGGLFLVIVML